MPWLVSAPAVRLPLMVLSCTVSPAAPPVTTMTTRSAACPDAPLFVIELLLIRKSVSVPALWLISMSCS